LWVNRLSTFEHCGHRQRPQSFAKGSAQVWTGTQQEEEEEDEEEEDLKKKDEANTSLV